MRVRARVCARAHPRVDIRTRARARTRAHAHACARARSYVHARARALQVVAAYGALAERGGGAASASRSFESLASEKRELQRLDAFPLARAEHAAHAREGAEAGAYAVLVRPLGREVARAFRLGRLAG